MISKQILYVEESGGFSILLAHPAFLLSVISSRSFFTQNKDGARDLRAPLLDPPLDERVDRVSKAHIFNIDLIQSLVCPCYYSYFSFERNLVFQVKNSIIFIFFTHFSSFCFFLKHFYNVMLKFNIIELSCHRLYLFFNYPF